MEPTERKPLFPGSMQNLLLEGCVSQPQWLAVSESFWGLGHLTSLCYTHAGNGPEVALSREETLPCRKEGFATLMASFAVSGYS